jgi:hypothetical protein
MSKMQRAVTIFGLVVLLAGEMSLLHAQDQNASFEQQLRAQYRLTHVGTNGTVVGEPGSVLVIEEDGLTALAASYGVYWYSNVKKGGRIKGSFVQHGGTAVPISERRFLQVGEKVYVLAMDINQAEVVFYVQSCGLCEPSAADPNNVPYRARLAIQFDKGSLVASNLKQVQDTVGEIFGADSGPTTNRPVSGKLTSATASLKLPAVYVSTQAPQDQLQLKNDHSFSLQEGGQSYHGNFTENGNKLELSISETNTTTTVTMQGNSLTDNSGHTWVMQDQTLQKSGPSEDALTNQDIVKMAKAGFDNATILSKIQKSQCDFDTSTDALIQLKHDGVSTSVIKAMVAGK